MPLVTKIKSKGIFPDIKRSILKILQVNLGYKCNQSCIHCHVDAGPNRWEMMNTENISLIPKVLSKYNIESLDLTGGAPELHPDFRRLVLQVRKLDIKVIDRCNLTILSEPFQEDLAEFLASNKVIVTASLPCYEKNNVDAQRGDGVFERSIFGLKLLNSLGYGHEDSGLELNLVYNPQGASLPPSQQILEENYKEVLYNKYKIKFSRLYTIANMPIKRFAYQLNINGNLKDYMALLVNSYNPKNLESVMCKELLSVDWNGKLYDCDFNQQLGIHMGKESYELKDLLVSQYEFENNHIRVGNHCFGCTAGNGSSCGGSLTNNNELIT